LSRQPAASGAADLVPAPDETRQPDRGRADC